MNQWASYPRKSEIVATVLKLEDRVFTSVIERDDARYGSLKKRLPGDCTIKELIVYFDCLNHLEKERNK